MLIRGKALKPTPFGYTLAIALLQTCGMVGLAQWALMSGGAGKSGDPELYHAILGSGDGRVILR